MLHRSFKPAKCKTSLKLASARLKLLKNRKDVQVNQLKKELAKVLESGQERTARIQVENVIREDKMVEAYGLLEIYCELIAARLQIVESQKNCPIDLKEAITSVIFAAPRCSDVTELQDVRKQLTLKYGKEFVSAAVELRPDCGVSRMLVEKLSLNATDGQTKMKILKGIADEHGVKWDPVLLEQDDLKPPQDLLSGPNTFVKVKIQADPPPPPPVQTTMPPTFQPPQSHYSTNSGSNTNDQRFNHEYENTSFKRPYSFNEEVFSPSVKNQNMEFENAAAAARAAAESADIACRAAKEAAEFASQGKFSRQPSPTDSHKSRFSDHSGNEEERRKDDRDSGNLSFQRRNSLLRDDVNHSRLDSLKSKTSSIDDNAERYSPMNYFSPDPSLKKQSSSHSDSLKSKTSSIDDNAERYSPKSYFSTEDLSLKKQSSILSDSLKSKTSSSIDDNAERYSPRNYFSPDPSLKKQSSSHSDSLKSKTSSSIDDNAERYSPRNYFSPDPSLKKQSSSFLDSLKSKTSSIDDNAERYSPKSYFSTEDPNLKKQSSNRSKTSSIDDNEERYSPKNYFSTEEQSLKKQSSSSHGRQSNSPIDNVGYYSEERLTTSAVFDDSGSDVEDNHEFHTVRKNNDGPPKPEQFVNRTSSSSSQSHHDVMPVTFDDSEGFGGGHSSDDESETDKSVFYDRKPSKFSPPSIRRRDDSSSEKILNFETLRGGFKHQKSRIPPYTSPTAQINKKKPKDDPVTASDSDDAVILPSPSSKRESSFKKVNTPPTRLQPKATYFGPSDDESETEEEHRPSPPSSSSQVSGKTNRLETSTTSALSWRTKPTHNNPKPTEAARPETRFGPGNYSKPVSFRQRTDTDVNPPKQQQQQQISINKKEQQLKMSSPSTTSTSTISTGGEGSGSTTTSVYNSENSLKSTSTDTASHVHPKLPDYDDIAARFQALRVNRR